MDYTINNFITYLARSKNGMDNWELITALDEEASQVKVWLSPDSDDILLAYEASPGFKGNFIVIKQYPNLEALTHRKASETIIFDRTLGLINEGTPSFEDVHFTGSLFTS